MLLDQTLRLETKMDGSASTTQAEIHVVYTDFTPDPNRTAVPLVFRSVTSHATDVTILAAPVNNQARRVEQLYIYNRDSAVQNFTVKTDDGTTERIIFKQTINSGRTLCYERDLGVYFI